MTRSGILVSLHVIQNRVPNRQDKNSSLLERQLDTLIEAMLLNPKVIVFPNT